jgi:hypothetical protein
MMRAKTMIGGLLLGALAGGGFGATVQARDNQAGDPAAAHALVARREINKCMLQHMVADRMLSYNAANSLCVELRRAAGANVADQTPGTIRKSRTAPSPKADSAA